MSLSHCGGLETCGFLSPCMQIVIVYATFIVESRKQLTWDTLSFQDLNDTLSNIPWGQISMVRRGELQRKPFYSKVGSRGRSGLVKFLLYVEILFSRNTPFLSMQSVLCKGVFKNVKDITQNKTRNVLNDNPIEFS